jgi:hypothetical protein
MAMKTYPLLLIGLLAGVLLLASCSGTGSAVDTPPVPQSGLEALSDLSGARADYNRYLWSYQFIWVDPSTNQFEVIPVREVQGHWNVLKFLEKGPCYQCLKVVGMTDSDHGTKLVDIQINHPFASLNLTGFDVRGIAMFRGSRVFPSMALNVPDGSLGDGELVNADGFTSLYCAGTELYDPTGFQSYVKGKFASVQAPNAKLNGYKRFITPGPSNTCNPFYAGTSITVTYDIDMPDTQFIIGYAVDASWAPPIIKPVTDPTTQFPPEASCPEAWQISVSDVPIGAGLTDCGGQVSVVIDVFDWQGKDEAYPVLVECPELFNDQIEATWKEDGAGFARYEAVVENAEFAPGGSYPCLVGKEAAENDPYKLWLDISAYQLHDLVVAVVPKEAPTAVAEASQLSAYIGEPVSFDASGSHDNDCGGPAIVKCEWDWDNDGTYDEEGIEVDHSWSTEGIYQVQLRVTDDDGQTDTLDEPLEMTILGKVPPVAIAIADPLIQGIDEPIHFSDDGSYDPDGGLIAKYEWDWDNDGTYDEEGAEIDHSWSTEGVYQVQFRVTDDESETDTLDEPLEVTIVIETPPVAMATGDPLNQVVFQSIHFSDDGSYDPDGGSIVLYEWDWENDGTFDEQGIETDHTWYAEGTYYVQFRVTDDEGQTDTLDTPLEITISPMTFPPVAQATADTLIQEVDLPIHFSDDGSFDPDGGSIVKYEWDWDNDGTFDEEGIELDHSWSSPGTYEVQFRVTDDEAQTDTLDQPLTVKIGIVPNELWARTWGGSTADQAYGVALDGSGNVYVTGYFSGTVDFDPGTGEEISTSNGGEDIFLSKFDPSGNFLWANTWGGSDADQGYGVAVYDSGDVYVYVAGYFSGSVDFDPGAGEDIRDSDGSADVFLSQFDSSGNFLWADTWGGSTSDQGYGVAVDSSGNPYVTGSFSGTADFDPGSGEDSRTSNGGTDILLSGFDSAGNYLWADTWGGSASDQGRGVAVYSTGDVYVTGSFTGTVDFDPGAIVDSRDSNGSTDVFLSQFDSIGNYFWADTWGGSAADQGNGVAVDASGNVFVTGGFSWSWTGGVDFDPGSGDDTRTSNGSYDIFLSKFDSLGNYFWADTWGGGGSDTGYGVAVDSLGNLLVTGGFSWSWFGDVDFDPGTGVDNRASEGSYDVYLSKFDSAGGYLWANTWGGAGSDQGYGVAVDEPGNTYVTGMYAETVDFDPGSVVDSHTSNGGSDVFLSKFEPE